MRIKDKGKRKKEKNLRKIELENFRKKKKVCVQGTEYSGQRSADIMCRQSDFQK